MRQSQEPLDAINILKATSYFQLMMQDQRAGLCQSSSIDLPQVFSQIDVKAIGKVSSGDLVKFLGVHRIAITERQSQYLIYISGSTNPFMDYQSFQLFFTNGDPDYIGNLDKSTSYHRGHLADEMIKNIGEIQVAQMLGKEVEAYRTVEKLKEDFIKKYGFSFKNIISAIDRQKKGRIDMVNLIEFVQRFGVQLSPQQFQSLGRRIFAKQASSLSYKEIMKLFSPFEPLNFPTYRKQSNFQQALTYINSQLANLNIDTQPLPFQPQPHSKTSTGFNRVIQNYRNPVIKNQGNKYFYDQNYYNQLKQYKTNYFNPNKDTKKKVQTQMIGPQYHDHFFSEYYLYLEEKNKLEHYYNKFGKKYAFESGGSGGGNKVGTGTI